ncbi:MAG: Flp pilus assembly complex ATPase component TadA [Candidatus Pacebacteria bacterium]|jgi:type IV pilus assembly protein PilB|nr:Flp pilus assembly complex ATPase component TadA [Candidatus Paceibacterota bacterium]
MSVLDILVKKKVVSEDEALSIKKEVASGAVLERVLIEKGVSDEEILAAKGEYLNIPVRSLGNISIPFEVLEYIPEDSASHYRFAPIGVVDGALEVGLVDPDNIEARDALNFIATKRGVPYKIFIISQQDFEKVVEMYKGITGEVTKALSELEDVLSVDKDKTAPVKKALGKTQTPNQKVDTLIIEDAPVVKIVATCVRYAVEGNASDVHIEAMRDNVRVRFRVDGSLYTSLVLPSKVHDAVVARIKVLSNMKLDEKRKPQDGRFSARIEGRKIDFRVSTFPSYYGEKVVMRILDPDKGVKKLDSIGFSDNDYKVVKEAIQRPYGLILITGPTGSGKSTTLYSMLNEVDRDTQNVLSLEDPVEYNMEGVSQSQVRPEIGYTFASGLRTTLRQDPDIILVGEIRDKETAQLAVQAALTGHLVFSTLHTNNAAGVIPRLIDMGVDPYLIAPTLIMAVGQRLVGVLAGGKKVPVEGSIKAFIDRQFEDLPEEYKAAVPKSDMVYVIDPTPEAPKGTKGRMAVFEVFRMDKEVENVLLKNPTELEISKVLRKKGMLTMREDGILKAYKGLVPFEEVTRL